MTLDSGIIPDTVPADITDTPSQYWMRAIVSAVRGSLAAGNGHTSVRSSESLRGPVSYTTGESDTRLSSCTSRSKTTCQLVCVSYTMQGKMGEGECR